MSASRPSASPARPAPASANASAGGARRGPSHPPPDPPVKSSAWPLAGSPAQPGRPGTPCCGAWRNNWAPPADRPGLRRGAQHARHPHALRGAAGALLQDPPGRFPPPSAAAWRSARKSPTPCSTPTTCCATPEGTERQERMSLKTWAGFEYRRITPMALFALQAAADAGEPRVRLNPQAGLATAPGFSSPTRLHVAIRTSPAGGAGRHRTGCAVCSRRMPARIPCRAADRRGAGPAPAAGTAGPALAPTVEALPLMVCRIAALPRHRPRRAGRSSWAKRSCMSGTKRRNTSTISSRLPPKRPTISPRASTS